MSALLLFIACETEPTTPTTATVSFSVVSGDGQSGTVGQPLASPLVIKATDSKGRPQRNLQVEFQVTSGGGSATPVSARTDQNGLAQATWTIGTSVSQAQRVEARASPSNALLGAFNATPLPGPPAPLVIQAGNGQTALHDTPVPIAPAVLVQDQYGNPIPGASVTFAVSAGGGSVTGSPATSGADGVATVGSWTLGTTAGANTLSASTAGATPATFTATAAAGPAVRMVLYEGSNQTATVLTPVPIDPAVRITDAAGNPVAHVRPTFVIVKQWPGTLSNSTPESDSNGVARVDSWTLSSVAVDPQRVRVTAAGVADTVFFSATATPSSPYFLLYESGDGQTAVTGTAVLRPPTAVVIDRYNNRVPATAVTFAVTEGGGSIVGANPATTDVNGYASVGWILGPEPGPNTLSATVAGIADAAVVHATAVSGSVNADRSSTGATPLTIAASSGGTTSTISVIARNAIDDPVPGATVTFAVSGEGNTIIQASAPTDSLGRATGRLSSTVAGTKVVTATVNGIVITQTTTVTVRGGPAATIALYAGDNQTALTGTPVPIIPAVIARDAFGNPAPGAELQFSIVLGGGQIGGGTGGRITGENGLAFADWTLGTSPGQNMMEVWSYALQTGFSFNATAFTRAASIEVQAGDAQTAAVRTAVPIHPTVLVRDSTGEPLSGAWVDFTVTRGNGSVTYPYPYWYFRTPIKTGADGLARLESWTLGPYAETNTLDARVSGTDMAVAFTATGTGSSWTRPADMPTQRFLLGAAEVGGLIYAVGGEDFTELATVEAYDPVTDTWATKTPMPTARYGPGVAAIDGRLYAVGGILGNDILGTLEVYDPTTNAWTTKASMPTPRAVLAVSVVNGILYAVGGGACVPPSPGAACSWQSVGTVEAYDPVTDTWTTKTLMPTPRHSLGAATVNGIIYAVGGQDTGSPEYFVATVEAYDPATDTWTSKASMPTPRYSLGVAALNGIVHALGGDGPPGITTLDTHETFDPVSNTWTVLPPMPSTRSYPGVAVFNGVLYVIGGNGSFATVEAYHP